MFSRVDISNIDIYMRRIIQYHVCSHIHSILIFFPFPLSPSLFVFVFFSFSSYIFTLYVVFCRSITGLLHNHIVSAFDCVLCVSVRRFFSHCVRILYCRWFIYGRIQSRRAFSRQWKSPGIRNSSKFRLQPK